MTDQPQTTEEEREAAEAARDAYYDLMAELGDLSPTSLDAIGWRNVRSALIRELEE